MIEQPKSSSLLVPARASRLGRATERSTGPSGVLLPAHRVVLQIGHLSDVGQPGSALPVIAGGEGASSEIFSIVRQRMRDWVLSKGVPEVPMSSGVHRLDDTRSLATATVYGETGAEAAMRMRLSEVTSQGIWRTTVIACVASASTPPLVGVELECADLGAGVAPKPPRLVRELMAALATRDGPAPLTTEPILIKGDAPEDLAHLVDVLCSEDRWLPVLVAARPVQPNTLWNSHWRKIVQQTAGQASLYLLDDTAAVDALRDLVYERHWVAPGAIRTFQPGVDPAWAPDGYRHRLLSFRRLSDPADKAWGNIIGAVHRHALAEPLPPQLSEATFYEADTEALQEARQARQNALAAAAQPDTHDTELRETIRELNDQLALSDEVNRELIDDRTQLDAKLSEASAQVRELTDEQELTHLEHAETLDELDQVKRELRELRIRFHQQGREAEAYPVVEAAEPPSSFEELLDRLTEFAHLDFRGDRAVTLELDDSPYAATWTRKAWQGLCALDSYAAVSTSSGFPGDFKAFCNSTPDGGYAISANQVAMGESEQTQNHPKRSAERILPVPRELDPTGKALMLAHIKLGNQGRIAPRIYFLDDTAGITRTVIVGFIGPHMTNTRT